MSRIVVVGSANMDYVVRQPRAAAPGETMFGRSFSRVPGGKGLNQAVAAARLGGDVTFLGSVGEDADGRDLVSALAGAGVEVGQVLRSAEGTGSAHIAVTDDGENSIVVVSAANASLTHLPDRWADAIDGAGMVVTQLEVPLPLVESALARGRRSGATTVLTPAPVVPLPATLLDLVDVLVPNEGEALELSGEVDAEAAARVLSAGRTAIVTLGSRGSIVAREGEILGLAPARPVTAVDTTGAGDTFVGGLSARLADGDDLVGAVRWATAAASIAVTRAGATASMPSRDEVLAVL